MELKEGAKVNIESGVEALVGKELGRGGQGIAYIIKLNDKQYALKWYTCKFADREAFRKNMQKNINEGPPDDKFLWPLFMTVEHKGQFGYVMNLRPKEFSDFSDILNNKVKFPSTAMVIKSALNIVNGFRELHRKGLSYQDLNDGNFFINVQTGAVLICDNDNVTPDGHKNAGNIGGKPGYMAPEIVRGAAHPNSLTDCHSLAVILFKLFCRHDPLMGEQYVKSVCITEQREAELYGTKPVFVFDPKDKSNRPVAGVHPNPIKLWPRYPAFLQEAFITSFVEGMKDPNKRLPENEWQKILIRLHDEVLICLTCKNELLLNQYGIGGIKCACGSTYSYPLRLKTDKYAVPLFPGNKLYACHTTGGSDDYDTLTGEVIVNKNNPTLWGIKNLSKNTWFITSPGGEAKPIESGAVVPIATQLPITLNSINALIIKEAQNGHSI